MFGMKFLHASAKVFQFVFVIALSFGSAIGFSYGVWYGGKYLFSAYPWTTAIIGPLAALAGLVGTVAGPGLVAIAIEWIGKKVRR